MRGRKEPTIQANPTTNNEEEQWNPKQADAYVTACIQHASVRTTLDPAAMGIPTQSPVSVHPMPLCQGRGWGVGWEVGDGRVGGGGGERTGIDMTAEGEVET